MDAIYEVRGLTKRYGRTAALNGVDFAVTPGKLVGLLGPNGSGKRQRQNNAYENLCRAFAAHGGQRHY